MRIDILTLFPEFFESPLKQSILKIAQEKNAVEINLINWREFATDNHKTVDDRPFGGGSGMVLKVDVLDQALTKLKNDHPDQTPRIALLTPQGHPLKQTHAQTLAKTSWLILICGHYEGFDERIREHLVDEEISIGDYVLSGGEPAALVVVDTITRLLPGVLGNDNSNKDESFTNILLEYPQYTRPQEYRGWEVPEVLLTGNHAEIEKWRREQAQRTTKKKRPDLTPSS